jgi:hypothetical protein
LWRKLTRWLSFHPLLKYFRDSTNSQIFNITAKNGVTIDCRIGGISGSGATVIGLHTPVLVLDEAGFFPWDVWIELLPTINTWEKGFQIFVCGTPSGQRENNVLYFADMESEQFTKHRVSAHENPRYTDSDEKKNRENYGSPDSDDYKRLVLGLHASPVELLFAKETVPLKPGAPFTATLTNTALAKDPLKLNRLLDSLPNKREVAAGIDLGYTDPTIISLFEKVGNHWINFGRIRLVHVEYPKQVKIINRLDNKYPFTFLAIDEGSSGLAVTQELLSNYPHKSYEGRLYSVNFSNTHVVGLDLDDNEIKLAVKNIGVEKLKSLFENKQLFLMEKDSKLLSELERVEKYRGRTKDLFRVRSVSGGVSSEDHRFASMICFSYAMYLREDHIPETEPKVKLYSARWIR